MKLTKAFMAGLTFPATFLPLMYLCAYWCGNSITQTHPVHFLVILMPLLFGLWNIGYWWIGKACPVKKRSPRLWITGASLGLTVSIIGVFVIHIPSWIGLSGSFQYLPLITHPILFGIIWRYIVHHLNNVVGLKEW